VGSDERLSLQKKGGWIYETNFSIILDAAARQNTREDKLKRATRDFRTRAAKHVEVHGGIFDIYCELPQISHFCLTNLSVKH
jgi:hypothetical protein